MVKNCDRGLENNARGRRPRAAISRPRSQFFTIRTVLYESIEHRAELKPSRHLPNCTMLGLFRDSSLALLR